ncbi:carbon monoxide dehydrogenase subunit G [Paucibacter sediminis]|uniref:Carbon monoxide dehydrogenase subunit G n=1 Tax=Paucibacter sediminis TaxID=3019553 RepID=A0AA95NJ79_9BURK|nr:carbon monoxide dehydrogenase subunit G [Paucibacter sp. S2-9]WIT14357.1 carbon monoxide dehydrogenase subunit G [Paucibacter sp. S2-9]
MKIENQRELPCSQAEAWAALNDEAMLQACIPGCESLTREGEQLQLLVMAAVGPVRARFKGQLQMQDVVAPVSYAMRFEGQGGVAGFGKGLAQVRLSVIDEQRCLLHYSADVQIGGKLAQIGSRVVDAAAQKIIGDFFARLEQALQARQPQLPLLPAPAAPPAGLLARLWAWLRVRVGLGALPSSLDQA